MISIVIPIYNTEKLFLEKCIQSILQQSYKEFELLLMDDGSKDEYREYLDQFLILDHRIRVTHAANQGVSAARNQGIKLAQGEYIAFIDADDWVEKDFLQQAVCYMEENQLDIVIGAVRNQYKDKSEIKGITSKNKITVYEEINIQKVIKQIISCSATQDVPELKNCMMGAVWCKLYRRDAIQSHKFNETIKIAEDSLFNVEVLSEAKRVGIAKDVWYNYRINSNSALKRYRSDYCKEIEQTLNAYRSLIKKQKAPLWDEYYLRVMKEFSTMMYQYVLHPECPMSMIEKCCYVKKTLDKPIWKEAFKKCNRDQLDKKHKLQLILGKKKLSMFILGFYYIASKKNQKKLF